MTYNIKDMNIFIYKRTHTGDPDNNGVFGINECMGKMREYNFDIVIGVGGKGSEAKSNNIDKKVNWIGINPKRTDQNKKVTFEYFKLFEDKGIMLAEIAPHIAKRLYEGKARFLFRSLTIYEKNEVEKIIKWSKDEGSSKHENNISKPVNTCGSINKECTSNKIC